VTAAFDNAEVQHALSAFEQGARQVIARRPDVAVGGELPLERRQQFARDAFCGQLQDTETVLSKCDEIIDAIAKRDRSLSGAGFAPACT
jgi:glutamate-1-semialdehyde 2,1-aminomutase